MNDVTDQLENMTRDHQFFNIEQGLNSGDPSIQAQAVEQLKQLVDQQHIDSIYAFGWCLLNGKGINKDIDLAKHYLQQAKDHKHQQATELLDILEKVQDLQQKLEISRRENYRKL
ncbi:SEL1-like repeat protein [Acinetobacter haemolyticus]|uniref:hypothetical protein n=1 Tax=Acinetobacter haemolyticus TaxID=29430 RepID=UPI0021CD649C|nr:hypothetical protein [Acinetobacter haemolyticus]MCU4378200.1 hypothetical protein [Acinetobacter haemolyticus]